MTSSGNFKDLDSGFIMLTVGASWSVYRHPMNVGPRCIGVPCYRAAPVHEHKSLPQGYIALPVYVSLVTTSL